MFFFILYRLFIYSTFALFDNNNIVIVMYNLSFMESDWIITVSYCHCFLLRRQMNGKRVFTGGIGYRYYCYH